MRWIAAAALLLAVVAAGCQRRSEVAAAAATPSATPLVFSGPLTVYCGRSQALMAPLLQRFGDESGVSLVVRYGETWPLEAQIEAEGTRTPAAVFVAGEATALGALSRKGLLAELPIEIVQQVHAAFAGNEGRHDWVGLTARTRVLVYDPAAIPVLRLPPTLEEFAAPQFARRLGIVPADDSFQAQLALYRVLQGPKALTAMLSGWKKNRPRLYADAAALVQAVTRGEILFGLVDEDAFRRETEAQHAGGLATLPLSSVGANAFVNASGVGALSADPRALQLVRFLVSAQSLQTMAQATYEESLARSAPADTALPPIVSRALPSYDFADLAAVREETIAAMQKAGLMVVPAPAGAPPAEVATRRLPRHRSRRPRTH